MGLFDKWKKKETGAGDAIVAVVNGEMIPPEQISDPTFAKELMGQTIGFEPADGTIVSPCDGIVEVLYPTRHAFALRRADGTGILVHIGIDTVNLNGDGFTAFVSEGDRVRAGDRIVEVDLSALRASHLEATTMLVIMEPAQPGQTITFTDYGVVRRGEIITRSQEAV